MVPYIHAMMVMAPHTFHSDVGRRVLYVRLEHRTCDVKFCMDEGFVCKHMLKVELKYD